MAVTERNLLAFPGWPLGLDNISHETKVRPKALREATNVDIGRGGELHRRRGYVQRVIGTAVHSVASFGGVTLFVDEGTLYRLNVDAWTTTPLLSGLTVNARMSYAPAEQLVYFSNGNQLGAYDSVSGTASAFLGVQDPGGQPVLAAVGYGGLVAGDYQVAITLLSAGGVESGSSVAASVSVPEGGGISLTALPSAAAVRVYLSAPNGTKEELWHHSDYPAGTTSAILGPRVLGRPLATQFLEPLPPGQHIRLFHGRLYVAVDNVLVYSDPFRRHLYAPDDNYVAFPERITALEPVEGGIFVASDQLYFLRGGEIKDVQLARVAAVTVAEGSSLCVPGSVFPALQANQTVAYFYSSRGPAVGMPDGNVVFPLHDRVAGDVEQYGATLLREQDGIRQLVTSLYGASEGSGFRASDYSVITVKRNGVEI